MAIGKLKPDNVDGSNQMVHGLQSGFNRDGVIDQMNCSNEKLIQENGMRIRIDIHTGEDKKIMPSTFSPKCCAIHGQIGPAPHTARNKTIPAMVKKGTAINRSINSRARELRNRDQNIQGVNM